MTQGLYLAFDYGTRRIGVAVGNQAAGQARPLAALHHGGTPDWRAILRLVEDWQPAGCVVGLPLDTDGGEQPVARAARKFAAQLEQHTHCKVALCDERFSSRAADGNIRRERASGQRKRRTRKGERDSAAACVILEQYLKQVGS